MYQPLYVDVIWTALEIKLMTESFAMIKPDLTENYYSEDEKLRVES